MCVAAPTPALPRLLPLYIAASLLRDALVAVLLLLLHSVALAPRVALAALRRRTGAPPLPQAPGTAFYEGVVTHTRVHPVFHTFTYPVRAAWRRGMRPAWHASVWGGVKPALLADMRVAPLPGAQRADRLGRAARVVHAAEGARCAARCVRSRAHALRLPRCAVAPTQPDCLSAAEARALAGTAGAVRLLTYAPSCGYEQNPISVYYCHPLPPAHAPPGAPLPPPQRAVAEVTNTPWGERVRFAFALGEDVLPKPLHVSPFMEMSPQWRITSDAPGDALALSFSVEAPSSGAVLFTARLRARRVAVAGPPEAWAWAMPHRVAWWIYLQAAQLAWKGVPFQSHPKYGGGASYRRAAADAEKPMRRIAAGARPGGCPAFAWREASAPPWTLQ